jgi:hypothetical protein
VANRPTGLRLGLLLGFAIAVLLACEIQPASARDGDTQSSSERFTFRKRELNKRTADANALASSEAYDSRGPYYVDFRARTAASWGHAFVWYGKTSERRVEVAGLTPSGDTLEYVLGYVMSMPSETGASYGDLDPQYLTANYRVYLNEADAKRVFAYIKKLRASSRIWNAEISNCTAFIGSIAEFMGLKVPHRWQRPEEYVNALRAMNGGRRIVHLPEEPQLASGQ